MRTAKYHDFTGLKIAVLLIVLVILGLFVYKQFIEQPPEHVPANALLVVTEPTCTEEGSKCKVCTDCGERYDYEVIPATGHSPLDAKIENEKPHTDTLGESYESVVYCKDCNLELSREVVYPNHESVTIITIEKVTLEPTCDEQGTKDVTYKCADCDYVSKVDRDVPVAAIGHHFEWSLIYVETESGKEPAVVGDCTATECDHVYDPRVDTGYTYTIDLVHPECYFGENQYVATIRFNYEVVATKTISFWGPLKNHMVYNFVTEEYVDIMEFALYDENGQLYFNYNYNEIEIILIYERKEGQTISQAMAAAWSKDGYAEGMIKCQSIEDGGCGKWITVRIYNNEEP